MTTRDYPKIITELPGPRGKPIVEKDAEYASTSYIKCYPLVVSHGEGPVVEDVDGNRFLDFMAGIAVASTGYAHPKVVEAVKEVSGRFFSMCSTDFYYPEMSDLCERLANLAPGSDKKRVFLTNSGTEAVEGAIKLVRNSRRRGGLIAFRGAFHGRSMGALSLTSSKVKQRAGFGPMLPGVHHAPYPDPYRDPPGKVTGAEYIRKVLFDSVVSPDDIAGIFLEPMLGEGGYIVPPKSFLEELRALCDETGILLVFDEIQSGAGRTGKMWAADHFGVAPDVLLTAKGLGSGLSIGAIVARESVMKWPPGSHGSTFGGSPVGCAAALATLDVLEKDGVMENARLMGEKLKAGMEKLQEKHSVIGDVRGVGLFVGVEFVEDRESKEPAAKLTEDLMQLAFQKGLLLLSCGHSTIRLAPPLVIDEQDVEIGVAIIDECLTELTA